MSEEIVKALSAYEIANPIEQYRFYDWNAWPLLRVIAGYLAVARQSGTGDGPEGVDLRKAIASIPFLGAAAVSLNRRLKALRLNRELASLREVDAPHQDELLAPGREVVILTISGRRQEMGGGLYEIYADPLAECLEAMGVPTLVWERLEERWPRCRRSAWITRRLELELLQAPQLPPLPEPSWYADFASLAERLAGRRYRWSECEPVIRALQRSSLVYQRWLQQVGAKALVSVCWYDAEVMAATLAARRLGVASVDLQHGAQGIGHFAYDGWGRGITPPFELVPDYFWCWGEEPATKVMLDNPAFASQCKAVPGGNLWLSAWRSHAVAYRDARFDAVRKQAAGKKVILFALQHGYRYSELVPEAVAQSPDDWFWLVRLHPATPEGEKGIIHRRLEALHPSKVEFVTATQAPLLSLMAISQVLITGSSTCALEALAFGLPSVTVTDEGAVVYREFIEGGVMLAAGSAEELVQRIKESETIDSARCLAASRRLFASAEESEAAIRAFLDGVGIRQRADRPAPPGGGRAV
ncbi:hypothetical protein GMSM_26140 [Geomonas sp. Red276]